jgi:endonuclease-3
VKRLQNLLKRKRKGNKDIGKRSQSKVMSPQDIDRFFEVLSTENPEPQTELEYLNPYTLLVAVVLSAQATDVSVNKATRLLFQNVDNPQRMVDLGEENLKNYIKSIGLYKTKAANVIKLSQILLDKFKGEIPSTREELETLPGVGRKTANVVLNVAYGEPTIPVDTHIFRVSNRTGLAPGKNPLEVEEKLLKRVPERWRKYSHHWLILHGRYICKARKPECKKCPVVHLCQYPEKLL